MTNASLLQDPLLISARHRQRLTRLPLIPSAAALTCEELRTQLQRRLALVRGEAFEIEWLDDDNIRYHINDDESLQDALEYFRPSESMRSRSSSGSDSSTPSIDPPIEMLVHVQVPSRISLSDLASSDGASSSQGSTSSHHHTEDWGDDDDDGSASSGVWERVERSSRYSAPLSQSGSSRSSGRAPLDGRRRMAPYQPDLVDEEAEDDARTEYAYSQSQGPHISAAQSVRYKDAASMVPTHQGVGCEVCEVQPIRGVRYVCLQCEGCPSFCGDCEDAGESIQYAPHLGIHMVLRLLEPLAQDASSDLARGHLAEALLRAATKLTAAARLSESGDAMAVSTRTLGERVAMPLESVGKSVTLAQTGSSGHDVQCSFCGELIGQGARYLCANCPLDLASHGSNTSSGTATPSVVSDGDKSVASRGTHARDLPAIWTPHEGFNLCSQCEKHSLSIHNPDHFFLYIPSPEQVARSGNVGITPLRLNPYLTIDQRKGLLPPLYSDDGGWEEARLRIQAGAPAMNGSAAPPAPAGPSAPSAFPPVGNAAQSASTFTAVNTEPPVAAPSPAFRLSRWMCPLPIDDIELTRLSLQERGEASGNAAVMAGSGQIPGAFPGTPPEEEQQAFSPAYLQHEEEYVRSLAHPNVLCDVCFGQINGCWTRCANCVSSFDVCVNCFPKAMETHPPTHSFAIFKRNVDIELYRSLVDHIDTQDGEVWGPQWGPTRAMIPLLLV